MSSANLLVTVTVLTAYEASSKVLTLTGLDEVLYEHRQLIVPVIDAVKGTKAYNTLPVLTFGTVIVVASWRDECYTLKTDTHAMYSHVEEFFQGLCYDEDVRKIRVI